LKSFSIYSEEGNRVNFISVYETKAGTYQMSFVANHEKFGKIMKVITILVVPSSFETIIFVD
jgi:hypothetical protein